MGSLTGGRRDGFYGILPRVLGVVLVFVCTTAALDTREYSVLVLPWLSFGGSLLTNQEILASFTVLPLALKHFNERNGSVLPWLAGFQCNATIAMVGGAMHDDEGLSSTAMAILVSALSEGSVDFMHGPARSDVVQTVAITAGALNLPIISYISTSQALSNRAQYPTLFRNVPSDEMFMSYLADLFARFKFQVIGVIHSSDAYGTSGRDALAQACEERKIRMRAVIYDPNAVGNALQDQMDRALGVLVGEKLNVIFRISVTELHEKAIARAAVKLDWVTGKLHIGRIPTTLSDVLKDEAPNGEVATFLAGSLNMLTIPPQTTALQRMFEAWTSADPDFINQYMPNGTTRAGQSYKITSDYLQNLQRRTSGVDRYSALAYDSIIALGVAACGPSTDLTANLRQARFLGVSGEFGFSARQTPDQKQSACLLQNFVPDLSPGAHLPLKMVEVGRVADGNWTIYQEILYSDRSNVPPVDVDRPENVIEVLPLGAKIFGWVEAGLALIASLWAVSQAPRLGRTTVSRPGRLDAMSNSSSSESEASQPRSVLTSTAMLLFLGLAATSMAVSIILLTLESQVGCMPFFWLCAPGFVLALAALSARAIEIWAFSKQKTMTGRAEKLDSIQQPESAEGSGHNSNHRAGPAVDHMSVGYGGGNNPPLMITSQLSSKSAGSSHPTNNETSASSDDNAGSRGSEAPGLSNVPDGTTPTSSFVVDAETQQQLMRRRSLGGESTRTTLKPRSWRSFCAFIGGIALVVGICLSILIAWQVVAPFVYALVVLQTDANDEFPLASVVTCVESSPSSSAFFISMLCLIGTLAVFTLMSALCVRNTSSLEARMATVASLCVFQVFFVGVPTAAAVWRTALSRFLVLSSITFVICMVIVCTMFLPRALSWRPRIFAKFPLRSSPYTPSRLISGMSSAPPGPRSIAVQQPTILRSKPVITVFMNDYTRSVKFAAGSYGDRADDGTGQQGEYGDLNNQQSNGAFPVQSPAQAFHQRTSLANFDTLSMAPKKLPGFVNLGQIDFSVVPPPPSGPHGLALGEVNTLAEVNHVPEANDDSFTKSSFLAPPSLFPAPDVFPHATSAFLPGFVSPSQNAIPAANGATSVDGGQFAPPPQSEHLVAEPATVSERQTQSANEDIARRLALV